MRAKKSFGQHFLRDKSVIKKIIVAGEIQPHESVLEIGPGHGVLTQALVDAGVSVTAVEADKDLIPELKQNFGDSINLIQADILSLPFSIYHLPSTNYKLIANLPYNITSAVLEKFLTANPAPKKMVLMIQKEVADRILAKPGEMSLLSVVCQLYANVRRVTNVPPGAFSPRPKVDSTVIVLDRKSEVSQESIIHLAKAGFKSRRKQLHRNLVDAKIASSDKTKSALKAMGLKETARAQELSVEEWTKLYIALS